jgi:hypothetical protein
LALATGLLLGSNTLAADTYVAHSGQTPGNYLSWGAAASNIQAAVNAATEGATVWVGPGTYTLPPNPTNVLGTNVVYINKALTLRSSNSVPESTIINGQGAYRGITFYYDKTTAKRFVIDGFTISNCWATNEGGGIRISYVGGNGTAVVQNCIISDNTLGGKVYSWGGGIYAKKNVAGFGLSISNCILRRNVATTANAAFLGVGGGLFTDYSTVRITDCTFDRNTAGLGGGALLGFASPNPLVENCTITSNLATKIPNASDSRCGGVEMRAPGTIRNCLLAGNKSETALADQFRVGLAGTYFMDNCTVVDGVGVAGGAAILLPATAINLVCRNSIICSNSLNLAAASRTSIGAAAGAYAYITNSFVRPLPTAGRYSLTDCITNGSPGFATFVGEDYHLTKGSVCCDNGLFQTWMTGAFDLDRNPRIDWSGKIVDRGCYEYTPQPPRGTLIAIH